MSRLANPAALAQLAAIAALKREAELARLARITQSRNRLLSALDSLRATEAPLDPSEGVVDPALLKARLAHRRWAEIQQRYLGQQLASVNADWSRARPAAARAFGRAAVLAQLHDASRKDKPRC